MARERSEMRRVKEVLRLRLAFGLSHKAISAACRMPRTTVRDYCQRAKAAGIDSFAAVEPLSERALEARLFTTGVDPDTPDADVARPPAGRPTPDWAVVHRELNKPGVTRILLWQEYLAQHPGGYRYRARPECRDGSSSRPRGDGQQPQWIWPQVGDHRHGQARSADPTRSPGQLRPAADRQVSAPVPRLRRQGDLDVRAGHE